MEAGLVPQESWLVFQRRTGIRCSVDRAPTSKSPERFCRDVENSLRSVPPMNTQSIPTARDYQALIKDLKAAGQFPTRILHLSSVTAERNNQRLSHSKRSGLGLLQPSRFGTSVRLGEHKRVDTDCVAPIGFIA